MIKDLQVLQLYGAMARHAAEAQSVSSANVSRAGEPGFKAKEIETFEDFVARTRAADEAGKLDSTFKTREANLPMSPNGNTVNLETEMIKSAEAFGQHNLALSVYSKSLDLLRSAIGSRR